MAQCFVLIWLGIHMHCDNEAVIITVLADSIQNKSILDCFFSQTSHKVGRTIFHIECAARGGTEVVKVVQLNAEGNG